jgi:hypothetical protein
MARTIYEDMYATAGMSRLRDPLPDPLDEIGLPSKGD